MIEGVQRSAIPLTTALEIARANENATKGDGQANLGDLLQEAHCSYSTERQTQAARSSKPSA